MQSKNDIIFLLFVNDLIFIELKFNWMIFFFVEYAKIEAIFFFSRFFLGVFSAQNANFGFVKCCVMMGFIRSFRYVEFDCYGKSAFRLCPSNNRFAVYFVDYMVFLQIFCRSVSFFLIFANLIERQCVNY